jgi:hypothetical protein
LSSDVIAQIGSALERRHVPDSPEHASFERSQAEWSARLQPEIEAIRASECLTEEDYSIRINLRD